MPRRIEPPLPMLRALRSTRTRASPSASTTAGVPSVLALSTTSTSWSVSPAASSAIVSPCSVFAIPAASLRAGTTTDRRGLDIGGSVFEVG